MTSIVVEPDTLVRIQWEYGWQQDGGDWLTIAELSGQTEVGERCTTGLLISDTDTSVVVAQHKHSKEHDEYSGIIVIPKRAIISIASATQMQLKTYNYQPTDDSR
ncbi:hypothetical protein KKF61_08735 [Patescibacteria group bacterium]|nr:hypothetical protein [Patescibacteria group bacterium]